jgi:hypothetical protein
MKLFLRIVNRMMIEYPITINKINFNEITKLYDPYGYRGKDIGKFVAIRSVHDKDGDKTYLGLYLGEFAVSLGVSYDKDKGELTVQRHMYNPAIYVFDLNKILFGYESWWGIIKSEEQLKTITDKDISNVWYVKALKQISNFEDGK